MLHYLKNTKTNFLILSISSAFACQHTDAGRRGKNPCYPPKFKMSYEFSKGLPEYVDLDVDMNRHDGDLLIRLSSTKKGDDLTIRVKSVEKGLLAILTLADKDIVPSEVSSYLIDDRGRNDPFLLVIQKEVDRRNKNVLVVRARETMDEPNRGIIKGNKVSIIHPDADLYYMHASEHHHDHGLISTKENELTKYYEMLGGKKAGQRLTFEEFQMEAEEYLRCVKERGLDEPESNTWNELKDESDELLEEDDYGETLKIE